MPKIVIDIPLGDYKWIKNHVMTVNEQMIASGKLLSEVLDDINAEIKMEITASWYKGKHAEYRDGLDKALEIIDRHIGGNE